jgi:hypothetical protein
MKVKWVLVLLTALFAASTFGAASGARASSTGGEPIHTAVSSSGLMDAFWFKQSTLTNGSCRSNPWSRSESSNSVSGQASAGDPPAAFTGFSPSPVAIDCPTISFGGLTGNVSGAHGEIVNAEASEDSSSAHVATRLATDDQSAAPPGGEPMYQLVRTSSFASASSTISDAITLSKATTVALVGDVAGSRSGMSTGSVESRLRFEGSGAPSAAAEAFSGRFLDDPGAPNASQRFSVSVALPAGTTSLEAALSATGSSVAVAGSDIGRDNDEGSVSLDLSMHYKVYVLDGGVAADSQSGRMPIVHGFPSDAPVADATWHTTGPGTVHLDGSGSHGDGLSYAWYVFSRPLGTAPQIDAVLGSPPGELGEWPVKLVVADALGRTATMLFSVDPGSDVPPSQTDTTAPTIACDSPDAAWHATDVSIACRASDSDSGLADASDSTFLLATSIPIGNETADAATGSRSVCDNAGNCAQAGPIGGIHVDRKAPTLTLPGAIVVDATSPSGAAVRYAVTATDGTDPSPRVACAPTSGTTIGIGTATVNCTAADRAGNAASGSFTVKVSGASEQIGALVDELLSMLNQPALSSTLRAQLQSAAQALIQRNPRAACTMLAAFTVAVRVTPPWLLTAAQKARLIDDATRIRAVIGC